MQLDFSFPRINKTYIGVTYRSAYGHRRFYPKSDDAKILCELLGSKTLTERELRICKEGGWDVEIYEPRHIHDLAFA